MNLADMPRNASANTETPLESWKEIGAYLQRDATTARRWEREEGLPVHRHSHKSRSSVYAYPSEIDAWRARRRVAPAAEPAGPPAWWRPMGVGATALLCLMMAGGGIHPQIVSAQSLAARQIPVKDAGSAWSFSRDGRSMATVAWEESGGVDLVVRDVSSGKDKIVQKTDCSTRENCRYPDRPLLSPDLKQVAYTLYDAHVNNGDGQLLVADNRPGATPRVVLQTGAWPAQWAPDGKSILAVTWMNGRPGWQIAWVRVADGNVTAVKSFPSGRTTIDNLSISPDGKYIVYDVRSNQLPSDQPIWILASDGSSETALTKGAGSYSAPIWAPDGKHVLFVSNQSGQADLWSIGVEAGKPAGAPYVVKRDIGGGLLKTLFVTTSGSLLYKIRRTDAYNTVAETAQSGGNMSLRSADKFSGRILGWSPDGASVAFLRFGKGLVVRSVGTGEERTYTHERLSMDSPPVWAHDGPPAWAHDGKSIVVTVANKNGDFSFHHLDLATGQFTEVVPADPEYSAFAQLSPDDKTLYIVGRSAPKPPFQTDHLLAYNLATGQRRTILANRRNTIFWFSPDGRKMAIRSADAATNGNTRLAVADPDGTNYREVYSGPRKDISEQGVLAWSPDSRSLLFSKWEPGRTDQDDTMIMRVPLEGGQPEFTGLRVPADVNFMVTSPDGSHVALTSQEATYELWSLDHVISALK